MKSVVNRRWPWIILSVLILSALVGGYWWFFVRGRVATDDAYVHADIASISSRIPGTVMRVLVDNDQPVQEGQVLVELDPRDNQVAVDRAGAILARIEAEIKAAEIGISVTDRQTQAQLETARAAFQKAKDQEREKYHQMEELQRSRMAALADLTYAQKEFDRYEALYRRGATSEKERDNAQTILRKASASLKAQGAGIEAIKASLKATQQEIGKAEAQIKLAQSDRDRVQIQGYQLDSLKAQLRESRAQFDEAKLNLSYCTIKAPIPGFIAQKDIQVGNRVQPGQPFMAIVPLHDVYVEANFKETQLENVRTGQPATVGADIYSGYIYHGKVVSIGAGTGAAFSLLPPENATGNWIKIVRRVPVRIELDRPPPSDHPLRVGLSLKVTIDTGNP